MRIGALVLVLLAFTACGSAGPYSYRMSQGDPYAEITTGTVARLHLVSNLVVNGELVQSGLDSVAVAVASGDRHAFAARDIRALRISGTRANTGTGAIVGLLIGGLIGVALGVTAGDACGLDAYATCSSGGSAAGGALAGGALGAGAGALLGSIRTSTWVSVPGPWRVVP